MVTILYLTTRQQWYYVTILLYIILCIMTFYNFSYIILFIIVGFHNLFVYKEE
jgi:hypothetical protein